MLGEIAITPDVFLEKEFPDSVEAALAWRHIKDLILRQCVVRNLHGGEWYRALESSKETLSPRAIHLLKQVSKRLRRDPFVGNDYPKNDAEWCIEAVGSHGELPLDRVVTTRSSKSQHRNNDLVIKVDAVTSHPITNTLIVARNTTHYLKVLDRVLTESNSVMFIDPYIDVMNNYSEFARLVCGCHRLGVPVQVEVHRACVDVNPNELQLRFEDYFRPCLHKLNVKVSVFFWSGFHDRFVISNLVGISLSNGFDIGRGAHDTAVWSLLDIRIRDEIQSKFDPQGGNKNGPHLIRKFTLHDVQ